MSKKTKLADLPAFDMAEHLVDKADIAEYLNQVLPEGDAGELAHALGVAAKARGMTQMAEASGIGREALYKALRPGARPRFDTIQRVCAALGVKLVRRDLRLTRTPLRAMEEYIISDRNSMTNPSFCQR